MSRPTTPLPSNQPTNDHATSSLHRLSQREYPPDCPPLNVRWYYAVDVPKRKPFQPQNTPPSKPPSKFVAFCARDSRAIEAAFQKLSEEEELAESTKYKRASAIELFTDASVGTGSFGGFGKPSQEKEVKVPVNEDYLFDVDIKRRELGPVYWEGPVYEVKRGTWFYQEGRPCDENLATQIEEGYLNLKPFRTVVAAATKEQPEAKPSKTTESSTDGEAPAKPVATTTTKDGVSTSSTQAQQQTWRLLGAHLNSFVVFVDPNTAWLFTDDFYGKLAATVWQRMSAGTHMGGIKLVRGYSEPKSTVTAPAAPAAPVAENKSAPSVDEKYQQRMPPAASSTSSTIRHPDDAPDRRMSVSSGRLALERKMSSYVDQQAEEKMMEAEIKEDYRDDDETDDPGREIEHLLLVTHGIGQKLSMKMESVNFVHDVNVFRKSLKGVYAVSPDLQVLNGETAESKRKNCRVQCLPVCWRHLLDFPKQSLRQNRGEQDLSSKDSGYEEEYPSLEDITVEGAPYVRNLMTDLALDVLLYQSGTYREHIIRTVLTECNRIYALFKERNPGFKGKISLVGHSLGSAIIFDILCRQPGDPGIVLAKNELPSLDFPVENFFALGSPVGLFQMLKGRTISARPNHGGDPVTSPLDESYGPFDPKPHSSTAEIPFLVSSPKCAQLFNVFHPADPISYRMEPLVSKAMAQLKPQPLPYTKRGLFSSNGQIVGGISGIGQSVTRSVATMWSSVYSGIASSILNRSLGITEPITSISTSGGDKKSGIHQMEGKHPPTMLDAEIETLFAGFQKQRKSGVLSDGDVDESRVRNEEDKVRALNSTGRIDFAIQEGVFDISVIASIASHLSYWGDEDVNHFVVSQLLSRSRVMKRSHKAGLGKGDLGDGWSIGGLE
ncbi:DDHD domain-containing protein [Tricharina praecox]|uniref:DDHD domain-containing protein n=1 Tax=Tricharina praecox TaxID=43433 RepID=UPI00221EE052|nr:DDHD domain-containing protein [Tricharina praecox]KAI5850613.1 DDHD domain-containing protein [Tricharina praecox]